MINQQKLIVIVLLFWVAFSIDSACAQKSVNSPYSRFGMGELAPQGTTRNKAMGGVGIALRDKYYINTMNPASYTTLDSTNFIFDVGITANFNQLENTRAKESHTEANLEYLAFAFPIKNWWGFSAGIRKVTNVEYNLDFNFKNNEFGIYNTQYEGSGGINKVYLSNGFQIGQNLSVGFTAIYNWGKIVEKKSISFEDGYGLPLYSKEVLKVSNFNFEFGTQYTAYFKKDKQLHIGATFSNKADLTGNYTKFLHRKTTLDTVSYTKLDNKVMELPNTFGIGVAVVSKKLTLAADANYQAWGSVASLNTENLGVNLKLKNSYKLALGAEFTPKRFSGRRFFDRLNYRAGVFYNNSNLEINGVQLKELGATAGLGIPIRNFYLNLALELGTRGTTDDNLIKENYAKVSLSFSIFETWFQKLLYK